MSEISYVPSFYHLSSVHHYHLACYIFDECLPNQNVNSMRTGISLSLPLSPSSCHPPSHLSYTPRKFCYKRVKKDIFLYFIYSCVYHALETDDTLRWVTLRIFIGFSTVDEHLRKPVRGW